MRSAAWMLVASLLGAGAGPGCGGEPPRPPDDRPSAILYLIDTLRADALGAYGNRSGATPHLDRFARGGVVFENAFANSSWTRASVASLFTGRHALSHGTATRASVLPERIETLAEMFSRNGYATAFVSTNPNVAACFGFGQGFDAMLEMYDRAEPGYVAMQELITPSDRVTRAAIEWMEANPGPFFLVLHTIDPHDPYAPPGEFDPDPDYAGSVDGNPLHFMRQKLDALDRRRIRSLYAGEVAFNDASFGALMAYLEESGRAADTLVVVTADHGEEFWEYGAGRRGHGIGLSDLELRVPLMVRFPSSDRVLPGQRESRPVQGVDVAPTFLDLLGLPPAEDLDGSSLFAPAPAPAPIYASLQLDDRDVHAVIQYPFKLVRDGTGGRDRLYQVRPAAAGGRPPDWQPLRGHPRIQRRLGRLLDAHVAGAAGPAASPGEAGPEVPARVGEALRALGYAE